MHMPGTYADSRVLSRGARKLKGCPAPPKLKRSESTSTGGLHCAITRRLALEVRNDGHAGPGPAGRLPLADRRSRAE